MAMRPRKIPPGSMTSEIGANSKFDPNNELRQDEFLRQLRGARGTRKLREMRENDPIVNALLFAVQMMILAVKWRTDPVDDSKLAQDAAEFVDTLWDDMEFTWEDFIGDVVSFLPYGFSVFEIVLKRRGGLSTNSPERRSRYDDGRIGIRKLAPRAQWTVERFIVDEHGAVLGVEQQAYTGHGLIQIPAAKMLHFTTNTTNNDPAGRSILRGAYMSYYYVSHLQTIEAIGMERNLNGLPIGYMPLDYFAPDAPEEMKAFRSEFERMLRDVKNNEQGYMLLPSDMQEDEDGKLSSSPLVRVELLSSSQGKDMRTSEVILRHQRDIARTVLADFLMLGADGAGSFALSKDKTDLFLRAIKGFTNNIASTINRDLLPRLFAVNGMDQGLVPRMVPEDPAPVDIRELGEFLQSLAASGAPLFPDDELEKFVREVAGLPAGGTDPDMLPGAARSETDDGASGQEV